MTDPQESDPRPASGSGLIAPTNEKVCPKCKLPKSTEDFDRNKAKKSGRESHCKDCVSKRKAENYRAKILAKACQERRRRKTKVLNVAEFDINEFYIEQPQESANQTMQDFIEVVLCKKNLG